MIACRKNRAEVMDHAWKTKTSENIIHVIITVTHTKDEMQSNDEAYAQRDLSQHFL